MGCCSLRVEHIKLFDHVDNVGDNVVEFDFLGKDSIRYVKRTIPSNLISVFRYTKQVSVEPRVYKNLRLFMENKDDDDELFDRLQVSDRTMRDENRCLFLDGKSQSIS